MLLPLPDGGSETCRLCCSISGPLQSVQRAEIWGVLVAFQGRAAMHVGVDNLNVVNNVGSLIAGRWSGRPFPLVNDGDLLLLVQRMVRCRGRGNTLVSEVKVDADEGMVAMGWVREVDRIGNDEADAAADMGRQRVHCSVTDARRLVNGACSCWYPVVKELHSFSLLSLLGLWLIMTVLVVLPCILWFGRMLPILKEGGSIERCGVCHGYLVQSHNGPRIESVVR